MSRWWSGCERVIGRVAGTVDVEASQFSVDIARNGQGNRASLAVVGISRSVGLLEVSACNKGLARQFMVRPAWATIDALITADQYTVLCPDDLGAVAG